MPKKTNRTRLHIPDAKEARAVFSRLKKAYGLPRLGNPTDPIDDLIYIMVSNKTSPEIAQRTYDALKKEYPDWSMLAHSNSRKVVRIMRPAGLARVKASQIQRALRKIEKDFGKISLDVVRMRSKNETLIYLRSLSGISDKVARCIMMYTMDAKVLPVDAHVHRIATRLGWTKRKRADQCHDELEAIVPPRWRYSFHVDCIEHGRQVCRPTNPVCDRCPISEYCQYFKHQKT